MDVPLGQIPTVPIRSIGPVQSQSNFNPTLAAVQIAKFANILLKRYVGSGSQCPRIDLKQTLVLTTSNQIYLVTLRPRQLTQASFLQKKKSNVAKCFFDISNAEIAQWRQK